jgi:hypothetical protein
MKSLSKIAKTLIANPVRRVCCGVAFVEHFGIVFDHELRPAKGAMIMVVPSSWLISTMNERGSEEVILLVCEAPILVVSHGVQKI